MVLGRPHGISGRLDGSRGGRGCAGRMRAGHHVVAQRGVGSAEDRSSDAVDRSGRELERGQDEERDDERRAEGEHGAGRRPGESYV